MAIHSSGQTIFSLTHIEGIPLSAGEEVDEVAGGASGMGVDRIGEVGNRASEGHINKKEIKVNHIKKRKVEKYKYHENRNKEGKISQTDE